jgi:hypothetical protein
MRASEVIPEPTVNCKVTLLAKYDKKQIIFKCYASAIKIDYSSAYGRNLTRIVYPARFRGRLLSEVTRREFKIDIGLKYIGKWK